MLPLSLQRSRRIECLPEMRASLLGFPSVQQKNFAELAGQDRDEDEQQEKGKGGWQKPALYKQEQDSPIRPACCEFTMPFRALASDVRI